MIKFSIRVITGRVGGEGVGKEGGESCLIGEEENRVVDFTTIGVCEEVGGSPVSGG